jgi:hypothetical protein
LVSSSIWGSWPDIYYYLTVTVLFLWDTLSDERTGLSFVYAAGPCQHKSFSGPSPLGLTTIFYYLRFEQSRAEQSSSLLPATSQHGHSLRRAPLGPMAIYLFSVKTFVFSPFCCSSFDKKKGGVGRFYNWCSFITPYFTRGHIKVGDMYILYIFTKHKLTLKFYYIQGHLSMQDSAAAYASTSLNLRNGS